MEIKSLLEKSSLDVKESVLILSSLLNVDKSYVYTYLDREVSSEVEDRFLKSIDLREKGYPLQYILKERNFMGMDFFVDEGVLVPRNDTEVLVEYIIDYVKENYAGITTYILDIGVGSGAISISLAKLLDQVNVVGVDISEDALKIANKNKEKFNLENVEFLQGDLFEPLDNSMKFNIIVSNPPYIRTDVIETLDTEVKDYEPMLALDGGLDGLDFYRRIIKNSKKYIINGGLLIFEIGYDQGDSVSKLMVEEGFIAVQVEKDFNGNDRIVFGKYYM